MKFVDKLERISEKNNSIISVGLDSDIQRLPKSVMSNNDPVFIFNKRIIDQTADLVCAYKLNLSFYESLGAKGWKSLEKTLNYIPEDIITIADSKRGDIGNSSRKYAEAFFNTLSFDGVTVNPYMGYDSLEPFLKYGDKGVFILCLTSNPGSFDFQKLKDENDTPLYIHVAKNIKKWNKYENCCAVVGATHPEELREIREILDSVPILIPGIGTQSGDLEKSVKWGTDHEGKYAIINVSRAIIFASTGPNFDKEAQSRCEELKDSINHYLGEKKKKTKGKKSEEK